MADTEQEQTPAGGEGMKRLADGVVDRLYALDYRRNIKSSDVVREVMRHDNAFIVLPRTCWKTYCLKEIMCRELTAAAANGEHIRAVFITTSKRAAERAKLDVENGMASGPCGIFRKRPPPPDPPVSLPAGVEVEWLLMRSPPLRSLDYATHVYIDDVEMLLPYYGQKENHFLDMITPLAEISDPVKRLRKLRMASMLMVPVIAEFVKARNNHDTNGIVTKQTFLPVV